MVYFGSGNLFSIFPKLLQSSALWNYPSSTCAGCPVGDANFAPERNEGQISFHKFSMYTMLLRQWKHEFCTRSVPPERAWMGAGSCLPCSKCFQLMDGSAAPLAAGIIQGGSQHRAAPKPGTCHQPPDTSLGAKPLPSPAVNHSL